MPTFHNIPITPAEGKEVAQILNRLYNRFWHKAPKSAYPIVKWLTDSYSAIKEVIYLATRSLTPEEKRSETPIIIRLLPKEIAMMHYAFDYLGKTFTVFQLPAVPEYEYIQKRVLYLLRITEDTPKPPRTPIRKEVEKNAA